MKLSILLLGAMLSSLTGCATAGPARLPKVSVTLREDGRIYVEDVYTGLSNLAPHLKKLGCGGATRITVEIPANTSSNAMAQISRELRTAGFGRFLFAKPRRAIAVVGDDPLLKRFKEAKGITNSAPARGP